MPSVHLLGQEAVSRRSAPEERSPECDASSGWPAQAAQSRDAAKERQSDQIFGPDCRNGGFSVNKVNITKNIITFFSQKIKEAIRFFNAGPAVSRRTKTAPPRVGKEPWNREKLQNPLSVIHCPNGLKP